ncbi:metalloprotease [Entomophthora muscae]|uniref:Metalloprotease n=1 Tax=Entomophthora muscae TaxID=34485 RepID=A0ACC2SGK3_9FUNG|nr:metalloprotease [Entomophthora muscae]
MRLGVLLFGLAAAEDGYATLDSGVLYGIQFGHFRLTNGMEVAVVSDNDSWGAAVLELGEGTKTEANPELKALSALTGSTQYPGTEGIHWFVYRHTGYVKVDVGYESVGVEVMVKAHHLQGALERMASSFHASARPDEKRALWLMTNQATFSQADRMAIQAVREAESNMVVYQPRAYMASKMKLAVVGREPIQEQIKAIADVFGSIPSTKQSPLQDQAPFAAEHLGIALLVVPTTNLIVMEIQFVIPSQFSNHASRPLQYIDYLLRSQAEGSLLHELQSRGLIRGAHTRTHLSTQTFAVYELDLTLDTLKHYQDILALLQGYLAQMQNELREDLHAELQFINKRNWIFQEKLMAPELASLLAKGLLEGAGPRLSLEPTSTFNGSLIQSLLQHFVTKNMRVTLVSPEWANRTDLKQEPQFATKYTTLPLHNLLNTSTHLPKPNKFLATRFDLVHHKTQTLTNPQEGVWHHPGLFTEKVSVHLGIQNGDLADCTSHAALLVLREMLWGSIHHLRFMATAGGIELDLFVSPLGLTFHIFGFSDKIASLAKELLSSLDTDATHLAKAIHKVNTTLDSVFVASPSLRQLTSSSIPSCLVFGTGSASATALTTSPPPLYVTSTSASFPAEGWKLLLLATSFLKMPSPLLKSPNSPCTPTPSTTSLPPPSLSPWPTTYIKSWPQQPILPLNTMLSCFPGKTTPPVLQRISLLLP